MQEVYKIKIAPLKLIEGTARIVLKGVDGEVLRELEIDSMMSDGSIVCKSVEEDFEIKPNFTFNLGS